MLPSRLPACDDSPMERPVLTPLTEAARPEGESGYVYHVTSIERAHEIAADGWLRAHEPGDYTDQETWPDGSVEPRVYFGATTNLLHFAPDEGEPVLLRMTRAEHKRDGTTPDLVLARDVAASELQILAGHTWTDLSGLAPSYDI
jgi:hypothetical protein